MAGVGSVIGSQLKTHAYPIMGGIVSCGAVYAVARRVLSESGRVLPLTLGLAAGLAAFVVTYNSTNSSSFEKDKTDHGKDNVNDSSNSDSTKSSSSDQAEKKIIPSLQNIKASSTFKAEDTKRAQEVIDLLARHESLLSELKIDGLVAKIEQSLKSDNIHEVLACEDFLDKYRIAGMQIGTSDDWIFPQSDEERGYVTIYSNRENLNLKATHAGCVDILKRLGITEDKGRPFKDVCCLALVLENSQVAEVTLYTKGKVQLGDSISIDKASRSAISYKKGLETMPPVSVNYSESQKKVANILVNTVWLNPEYKDFKEGLDNAVRNSDRFKEVLDILADVAFKGKGKQMKFGEEVFKNRLNIDGNNDAQLLELCTFTTNRDQLHDTEFDLEMIRDQAAVVGVPLVLGNDLIMMNLDSLHRLLIKGAEILAIKQILDRSSSINRIILPKELQHSDVSSDPNYSRDLFLNKTVPMVCPFRDEKPNNYQVSFNIQHILKELPSPLNIQKVTFLEDRVDFVLKNPPGKVESMEAPRWVNTGMKQYYSKDRPVISDV
ncbi:MAG: hypothetical protein ABSA17_06400 [Rhabdochlamydiaceae bacterium]|jgi:hypothetical protein